MPPSVEIDPSLFKYHVLRRSKALFITAAFLPFVVLLIAVLASLFTFYKHTITQKLHDALFSHQPTLSYVRTNQSAAAASALSASNPLPSQSSTSTSATSTTIAWSAPQQVSIIQKPVIETIVEQAPPQKLASFVSPSTLSDALANLRSDLLSRISNITNPTPAVPEATAAGGYSVALSYAPPAAQRIDDLHNVTVSGVSGLTASDIPALPYLCARRWNSWPLERRRFAAAAE